MPAAWRVLMVVFLVWRMAGQMHAQQTESVAPLPTLQALRWEESVLHVVTSGKVNFQTFTLREPLRAVIDISPCTLPPETIQPEGDTPTAVERIRWAQFKEGVVRVVLDLREETPFAFSTASEGNLATLALGTAPSPASDKPRTASTPAKNNPPPPPPPADLLQAQWLADGEEARLQMQLSRRVPVRLRPLKEGYTTILEMPQVKPGDGLPADWSVKHPLIEQVQFSGDTKGARSALVIRTTRAASLRVEYDKEKPIITLAVNRPRNAHGKLSEKHIVIDPGHGGTSKGAVGRGADGIVYEKDITLAIALMVRDLLVKEKATVTMTREDDSTVDLYDRPKLANEKGADFFISIHCDSTPKPNSASGTTTYFHASDPDGRALAQAIQKHVSAVTGLPNRGAQTDTAIYQSGFAVLRRSEMPAVLIEVAYINNDTDRAKLKDPKFQKKVAEAIVAGLKAYIEGEKEQRMAQEEVEIRPAANQSEDEQIQIPEPL
ncbi:MAG: N-acetylmuramoyl-L-alanine amidase [Chthonomonadetes bacterium]|nr:N-acetylmuramoyl-L-alanine amidase [Chthonomonadetes bacterium]